MGFQSNSGPTVDGSARHTEHVAFSVIIPTYNRAALTARAVDSVLENSACGRLEVLVVDDASSDGSLDMLGARYAGEARVRVISMSGNQGPSAARNRGLQAATGTFLLFLDSDDTLLPDALAFALAAFEKAPEMQFLGLEGNAVNASTGAWVHDAQKRWNPGWRSVHFGDWPSRTMQVPPPEGIEAPPATLRVGSLSEAILFGDLFYLSGVVLRRKAVQAAGFFNERFRLQEDWEFMARVCRTGPGGYLGHNGFCREHGRADQLSALGSRWRAAVMHQRVLDTIRAGVDAGDDPSLRLLRRAQAAADYELGRGLLAHGRYRQARSRFARVMSQGHKPIRSLVWLACAWFAPASTSVFGALKSPLGRKISPGAMGESTRTRWAKKAS